MNLSETTYKYRVEYIKRGIWVPMIQTDFEDKDTFELIANADEYQYRIFCDGVDVTENYKKSKLVNAAGLF